MSTDQGGVQTFVQEAQPEPSAADQVVDTWFAETFSGIPLAVEYFNRFRVAAEELKKRLAAPKE